MGSKTIDGATTAHESRSIMYLTNISAMSNNRNVPVM